MRPVFDRVSREFAALGVLPCSFSSVSSPSISCTDSLTRCLQFRRYDPSEVLTTCDHGTVSSTTIPEVSWSRIHTVSPGSNKGSSLALWCWSWFRLCLSLIRWSFSSSSEELTTLGVLCSRTIGRVVQRFLLMSSWAGVNPHSSEVLRYAKSAR